jgi:phospholipid transport system substrate-binding protein
MDAIRHALVLALVALAAALTLQTVGAAEAPGPGAALALHIDRVFQALQDPALKPAEQVEARRAAVRAAVTEIFDFVEASRRALGRHWEERTPEEQARFVRLFTDLLDRGYLSRIELYDGEQVLVTGETVEGDAAVVHTVVATKDGSRTAVDYAMLRAEEPGWRVWDVRIAGMSLVASYRAQFHKIIRTASWDDLLHRLEVRVGGLTNP